MENNNTILPLAVGDLLIESVGSEIRFWKILPNKKLRQIGLSSTLLRQRSLTRYPVLSDEDKLVAYADGSPLPSVTTEPAADLTTARVFSRVTGPDLVRRYFPEAQNLHFYYQGHGPSGQMWGLYANSRYTVVAQQEVQ